jgi:predicted GNAT superfamily acetyltransferase
MAPAGTNELTVRELRPEDYPQCEELQRHVWGEGFRELVPPSMMRINQKLGGLVAGAFDPGGRLVAFVYGLPGLRDGRPFHWSHMLGVHDDFRGHGLGRELKLFQRRWLLARGIDEVEWTYDPLESRNAHLNLNRLGAEPVDYQRDVYGDGSASELHSGIGTDRFVVRWRLADSEVEARIAGRAAAPTAAHRAAPVVNAGDDGPFEPPFELPAAGALRVAVPANVQAVKTAAPETAKRWRRSTRFVFEALLARGYRVAHLLSERGAELSYYVLVRP